MRRPPAPVGIDPVELALTGTRRIAVVGLSDDPSRESHGVAAALQRAGYEIVPVNPMVDTVLGQRAYPDLASVPGRIDLVDVFRRTEHLAGVAAEAAARDDVAVLWNQLGLRSSAAAETARAAGQVYVEDRCLKVDVVRRQARPPVGPRLDQEVVLLDLDDTVLDHDASERAAAATTLAAFGLPADDEAVDTYATVNAAAWAEYRGGRLDAPTLRVVRWERTLAALGRVDDVDAAAIGAAYLDEFGGSGTLLPGAAAAVWWLARRAEVAVATNGFTDTQTRRLAATGLAALVPIVSSSEAAGVAKPDPASLHRALERLGTGPDARVAMVGDQLATDVAAGNAIGATTVWIAPADAVAPGDGPQPDHHVQRLADIA